MTYKFSPSSLSLLKDCPRCFWLRFNRKINRPDSIFPSLPGGMDIMKKLVTIVTLCEAKKMYKNNALIMFQDKQKVKIVEENLT